MRIVSLIISVFASVGFSAERISPNEYEFFPRYQVHVFQVGSSKDTKVCLGTFLNRKRGKHSFFAAVPNDEARCDKVSDYGDDDLAFVGEGFYPIDPASVSKEDDPTRVKINGTLWVAALYPVVVSRAVKENSNGKHEYAKFCLLTLVRESQRGDKFSTEKYLFCKPMPQDGNMEQGKVICPLPEKCLSKEFAIQPVESFSPFQDNTVAHSNSESRTDAQVTHPEDSTLTSTRPEADERK